MSAELAVQVAIRARLVATPAVVALVPAASILDSSQRPAPNPSIILGESQALDEGTSIRRKHLRVFHTIHVWKKEPSLEGAKAICGAIKAAVQLGNLALGTGFHAADTKFSSARQMRDPDGETSHGIVVVEVLVVEVGT